MIAVGVANPKAQGQAMTNTEIVIVSAKIHDSCPKKNHASPASNACQSRSEQKHPKLCQLIVQLGL